MSPYARLMTQIKWKEDNECPIRRIVEILTFQDLTR